MDLILKEALACDNPNSQNLKDVSSTQYIEKNIVLNEYNQPLAFSAVEDYSTESVKICRVLTRTYYMKRARLLRMSQRIISGPIVRVLLPYQIQLIADLKYDLAFVSMETLEKRKVLSSWTAAVNDWLPGWQLLDHMYLTCKHSRGPEKMKCWQNISFYTLKPADFLLPSMTVDNYKERFIKNV
jgi:hypothetical protein